jgi:nucleoside-diphosphate-sugar epimerase
VYGPGDFKHRLFPIVKRIDDGRKVILLEEQLGQWVAPRGYVENVAAAIVSAAISERARGRIYNVAEPQGFSELEWTRVVARAAGWDGEVRIVSSEKAPRHIRMSGNLEQHWSADSSRIRRELGYCEPVGLEEALKTTIAWERENPPGEVDPAQFDYAAEDECLK